MIAAADVGGHKLALGLVENGKIVRKDVVPTPPERTPEAVCSVLRGLLEAWGADVAMPLAMGVPGMVSFDAQEVYRCPNLHGWDKLKAQRLGELAGHPVTVLNDCDCAALGEMAHGAARGLENFVFVTLGTGIGGSIILNGQLVRGSKGRAGELGHLPLMEDSACGCGGRGHVESFFSADALERAGEKTGYGRDMKVLWANRENRWLALYFGRALTALACAFASVTHLLDPEAIVVGGGLSHLDGLLDDVQDYMQPLLSPPYKPGPRLLLAELDADGPLLGAAASITR